MSLITVTPAQVGPVFSKFGKAEIYDFIASETITIGDAVCIVAGTGLIAPANSGAAGTAQFKGIALTAGGAGQAISVLVHGPVYGFTLASNYGAKVYTATTDGRLDTGATGVTCEVGEVWPLSDRIVATGYPNKVLFIDVNIGDEAHS